MTHPNRARLSKLSLGLMLALAAAPAFAQSTSSGIGGTVVGADGKPVAGAEVTITHVESGTVSRATTDANGRYAARGLRVGGREDHAQADQEQHDAARDRDRLLAQVHQLQRVLPAPQEQHQHAQCDQQLARQHPALAGWRQALEQAQEYRNVAQRVQDQEQQQGSGDDGHAVASTSTPR